MPAKSLEHPGFPIKQIKISNRPEADMPTAWGQRCPADEDEVPASKPSWCRSPGAESCRAARYRSSRWCHRERGPLQVHSLPGHEGTVLQPQDKLPTLSSDLRLALAHPSQLDFFQKGEGKEGRGFPKASRSLQPQRPGPGAQSQALGAPFPSHHREKHLTKISGARCAPLSFQVRRQHP